MARRSNAPTVSDYADAVKVLKRIYKRRHVAILFKKGYAGRELIPSQTRPIPDAPSTLPSESASVLSLATTVSLPDGHLSQSDVLDHFATMDTALDVPAIPLPTTQRFTTVAYTDASFAVGEFKDSTAGYVIFVNGTPIVWDSMRQPDGADSTSSVEFVAASVCCKQLVHVENMFRFFGFVCPKPYPIYTDSQASLSIAMNDKRMGKIRHIAIRYHLVRKLALNRDVVLVFCVTEEMIADLLTKVLSGAAYDHLSARFYFLGL